MELFEHLICHHIVKMILFRGVNVLVMTFRRNNVDLF